MSELLFKRKCTVTIGSRSESEQKIYDEKFLIDFQVNRNIEGKTPDTATIKLYNVDDSLFLNFLQLQDAFVRIEAGYNNLFGTVFDGDIVWSYETIERSDKVTIIEAKDGERALNEARLTKSYAPKVSLKDIANDLIDTMKNTGSMLVSSITTGNIKNAFTDKIDFGKVINGNSARQLTEIVSRAGFQYNIVNNTLYIHQGTTNEFIINLTFDTGLIGSPKKKQIQRIVNNRKIRTEGVEFEALLQPGLIPSQEVLIRSRFIDGFFTIQDVTYTGSTRGASWKASGFAI